MSDTYDYKTGRGDPSWLDTANEMVASFVPGLNVAQALRDYKRSSEDKDTIGQITSALGVVPGVGAATKAVALAGLLRRPGQQFLTHGSEALRFKDPVSGQLRKHLTAPSFAATKDAPFTGVGSTSLVPSEANLARSNYKANLYDTDADTLRMEDIRAGNRDLETARMPGVRKLETWDDFQAARLGIPGQSPYGELKLKEWNVPLTPDMFPGALLRRGDPWEEPGYADAFKKMADKRGIKTLEVPPDADPEMLKQMYAYIQGLRK